MKRILLAALLVLGATAAARADGLTPVGQKIYDKLKARPDIGSVCQDKDKLGDATRETVRGMIIAGEVEGRPRDDARAAAAKIHADCATFKH